MVAKVCVVIGAGEKLGFAIAKKYASQGFKVVVSRRSEVSQQQLKSIGAVDSVKCDVTSESDVASLVEQVESRHGPIHTVIYNAGTGFIFKNWDQVTLEEFDTSFNTNAKGLLMVAKQVCPGMVARGEGVLAITGATASLRGKPFTTAFAPSKGAQRLLAQSLARDLGPKGVHVFYTIIDGLMKTENSDATLHPEHVAETYWSVANQPRSAWTFEIDLRPFGETW